LGALFSDLAAQFHQAFIEADRWQRYLDGIGVSFTVTIGALVIGIILGVLVAVVRTLHDQQKPSEQNALPGTTATSALSSSSSAKVIESLTCT
jgi:ABC-type amino acid transport system permease subunit